MSAESPERATPTSVPVVGVGASAGGLDAFTRLLGDLPEDTGFAFVLIQHLDAQHRSALAEILSRATAMPVSEATDGRALQANHVYVIPPNVDLSISAGTMTSAQRTETPGVHMPIDSFLRSLAEECGSRAIAVVLSGANSDASRGVEAVKGAGGVTFAQDAPSAKFPFMPQAAAATGCVDFILPPEGIAAELARIALHPYVADDPPSLPEPGSDDDDALFRSVVSILHESTGIDFSLYREKMVKRRILRRLALGNFHRLGEYAKRLEKDPDELKALHKDLLISVTSFFRDPQSFVRMKETVFPAIFKRRRENDPIRVWAAGCATGEEAYSIAIALQEYMDETGAVFPVRIFATDISADAIKTARSGRYHENAAADLTPERLNRYFKKVEGGYKVNDELRDRCVFSPHNLMDDPPFSKLDLISCRNVLIYMESGRKEILPLFHYALKPGGFLLLGASEAVTSDELFTAVDRERRIYARRETVRKPPAVHTPTHGLRPGAAGHTAGSAPAAGSWHSRDVRKEVDRILLSRYGPAGVIVDEDLDVIEIRGKAGPYLALPTGKVSFNLIKLLPDTGLFLTVEKLIHRARERDEPVHEDDVPYDDDGGRLRVEVVPLEAGQRPSALVLFEPADDGERPQAERPDTPSGDEVRDGQIARLKQQLSEAKERFLATVEDHQVSQEESQHTTAEALSANEELLSLNEELETAKEELQSTNEELGTVNAELQSKNEELAQARDFAVSVVETIRHPLLVLNTDLRVRMANRAFCQTFQLSRRETEGQLLFALPDGAWDLPGVRDALENLRRSGRAFDDLELDQHFPGVGPRSLVFGACLINHLGMILLAVDDVTERKQAQERIREAEKMEAVGKLAGGIAHDFNNLLTAIMGHSDLLSQRLAGDEEAVEHLRAIQTAGQSAASVTQQLLAFSRRQVLQPKVVDLNAIVKDFDRMLRRLVDEHITVEIGLDPSLRPVMADPSEIGRVIMNLALNAQEAMPNGGALTITTTHETLTQAEAAELNLPPGDYVALAVADTGMGISPDVRPHIFEPFFTTKQIGKGTGLGLATVLGIAEQSGGAIRCESEPGHGAVFTILLPAVVATQEERTYSEARPDQPTGSEVVLLVEDESTVRRLVRVVLEARGYVVQEASNGAEGLELCKTHDGPIDLLLSDVVMPEMGGRELAEKVLELRPNLKVLFMSGHTQDVALQEGVRNGAAFLQKPFSPGDLARKVRETLDAGSADKS